MDQSEEQAFQISNFIQFHDMFYVLLYEYWYWGQQLDVNSSRVDTWPRQGKFMVIEQTSPYFVCEIYHEEVKVPSGQDFPNIDDEYPNELS